MRSSLQNDFGNGMLEMLLFTPLAMLLLFVGVDAGLAYSERAAITNAVRAGLNQQTIATANAGLMHFRDGEFVLDEARAVYAVEQIATSIGRTVLQAQGLPADSIPAHFHVRTHLVRIDIDPETGQRLGREVIGSGEFPSGSAFNLDALAPDSRRETLDGFLAGTVDVQANQGPSGFSVPLTPVFPRQGSLSGELPRRYLPASFALVAEVDALMRGISPFITEKLLQGLYSHREYQIALLRTQIR